MTYTAIIDVSDGRDADLLMEKFAERRMNVFITPGILLCGAGDAIRHPSFRVQIEFSTNDETFDLDYFRNYSEYSHALQQADKFFNETYQDILESMGPNCSLNGEYQIGVPLIYGVSFVD